MPRVRVRYLRRVLYAFVWVDVLVTASWAAAHRLAPPEAYQPLLFARALGLPHPTPTAIVIVQVALLAAAAVALTGRRPRMTGAVVFALYLVWMTINMSYGKVDHDRFAFLVALAVLPTVGAVDRGDRSSDEAAGWALRMVQVAVMATYFLAAVAKLRFGGIGWVNSATLLRAVERRGTFLGEALAGQPALLHASQYLIVAFELASPLMLVRGRVGQAFIGGAVLLHIVTALTTGITFLPHVMCLLAFAPLERLAGWSWRRATPDRAGGRQASSRGSPPPSR